MDEDRLEAANKAVNETISKCTGDQIIEIGIGLIARGLYRIKEQQGNQAVSDKADHVSSFTTRMNLDYMRLASKDDY